jgi:outer membrane receptor protein involved in Fe transport
MARPQHPPSRLTVLGAALATAGLVVSLPAAAQQSSATKAEADTTQTVVISANKRLETQREVAGTVSVLQGSDLERRGARDQEDFLKLTPGVQLNRGDPNGSGITIRGLSSQASPESGGAQQNASGSYLEDVPLASPIGKGLVADILPFDLDRIEVLRGPQGALFGSGSLGGAVRYLLAKPELKAFGATVQVGASSVSQGKTAASLYGMVNAPLGDTAAVRVVAFDRTAPGYIDNKGTNTKDANEVRQTGGRVLFTVKPVRNLTATFVASTQKTRQDDFSYVFGDPKKLEHDNPSLGRGTSQFDFSSLTVDYDLGGAILTSVTGYWKAKSNSAGDDTKLFATLGLPLPIVSRSAASSSDAKSQELRISSKPGGSFSWVAGLFYQTNKGSGAAKQSDPSGAFGVVDLVDLQTTSEGTEKAFFFDGEYSLAGGWSVGLGGRFYKTSTAFQQTGTVFGGPSNGPLLAGGDSGNTPKVSVKYRFGDNIWYALASKGYRYGGVNEGPPQSTYKSDSLWNYETGVRLSPAKGVQLDLTAFLMDWTNAQFTYFEQRGQLAFSGIGNVGKARSTGLEAALRWRINTAFDVAASLAHIDAKTTKDVQTLAGRQPVTIASGARLPGTARLQTALQGNYRFTGPLGSAGRFNITHTHVGERVIDLTGFYKAPAYDTIDLGVNFNKGPWTVAAGIGNVADKRGIMNIQGTPDGNQAFQQYYLQRPRTLDVSVRYDF